MNTTKKKIETQKAPPAIGPFSQAIQVDLSKDQLLFVSGQLPIDPQTGKLVTATFREAANQVFNNIEAILAAAKVTFSDVVRVEVFLKDMNDFAELNEIYKQHFTEQPFPTRQTIQTKLPLDALLEISCIALHQAQ